MTTAGPASRTGRTLAAFTAGLVVVFAAAFGLGRLVPPIDGPAAVPTSTTPAVPSVHAPMTDGPHAG